MPNSDERTRFSRFIEIAFYAALSLIYVWLMGGFKVQALFDAVYDDALFMKLAGHILNGAWLGPYDVLTLVKGPGYPLFIAAAYSLGMPIVTLQALLYAGACLTLCVAVRPALRAHWPLVALFAMLLFNPANGSPQRIVRDFVYASQSVFVLACAIGAFFRRDRSIGVLAGWLSGCGFFLGWMAITREDGIWILPPLIALAIVGVAMLAASRTRQWILRASLFVCVPAIIHVAMILGVSLVNLRAYGGFIETEFTAREFNDAYGALLRVAPEQDVQRVPLSRATRQRLYPLSPAFRELQPALEGPDAGWVCRAGYTGYECLLVAENEIPGTWFVWALRDAVNTAGHHRSLPESRQYYARLAGEINAACDSGRIACLAPRSGFAPPLGRDSIPVIGASFASALEYVAQFRLASPSAHASLPSSPASAADMAALRVFLDDSLPFQDQSTDGATHLSGWAASASGYLTYSIQNGLGEAQPGSVTSVASPDITAYLSQQSGRPVAFADRARFAITTPCAQACQIVLSDANQQHIAFPIVRSGQRLEGAGILGYLDRVVALPPTSILWREHDRWKLRVLSDIQSVYQFGAEKLAQLALIALIIGGALMFTTRRDSVAEWWLACIALGIGLFCRIFVVALVDATSFRAVNYLYLSPDYPLLLAVSGVALIGAFRSATTAWFTRGTSSVKSTRLAP